MLQLQVKRERREERVMAQSHECSHWANTRYGLWEPEEGYWNLSGVKESLHWEGLFRHIKGDQGYVFDAWWAYGQIIATHTSDVTFLISISLAWKIFRNDTYFIRSSLTIAALAEQARLTWAEKRVREGATHTRQEGWENTVLRDFQAACYQWKHFYFTPLFMFLYVCLFSFILLFFFISSPLPPFNKGKGILLFLEC